MRDVDVRYKRAVEALASDLLTRPLYELSAWPDYGTIHTRVDGREIPVDFWHYRRDDDLEHIVFFGGRSLMIGYRPFASGVVFGPHTAPRLMSDEKAWECY